MRKKTLLKSLINLITRSEQRNKNNISKKEAISIQQEYISNTKESNGNSYTPPFIEIAKQLSSPQQEIFKAAIYYLKQIAINESRNRPQIRTLLQEYLQNSLRSNEDNFFISKTISEIDDYCKK